MKMRRATRAKRPPRGRRWPSGGRRSGLWACSAVFGVRPRRALGVRCDRRSFHSFLVS
jgi:hypothetical protein